MQLLKRLSTLWAHTEKSQRYNIKNFFKDGDKVYIKILCSCLHICIHKETLEEYNSLITSLCLLWADRHTAGTVWMRDGNGKENFQCVPLYSFLYFTKH